MMQNEFLGFCRENGSVGTRNYVGVLSTVVCVNEVVDKIVGQVHGTAKFTHQQGCCQTPLDINIVNHVLVGLASNPNLHSVILVGLGCESTDVAWVVQQIRATGKRVEQVTVQEAGGSAQAIMQGVLLAQEMVKEASEQERKLFPLEKLILGLKCGSSDTTSGLVPNPAIGIASDLLIRAGGTSVLGEVTEYIGAEHILARHAANAQVSQGILKLVERMEKRAMSVGEDIRGGQPTGGNIKGGLTTIEEKSLGAIAKAGSAPIQAVYEYGERPQVKGLVVMDSPGREPEILTGLAAAGCNIIVFSTGRGAPQGFPFVPVLKVTGSRTAEKMMGDHIDLELSGVICGDDTIERAGERIFEELVRVASGTMTKAEIIGYSNSMDIFMRGPVI
jgi:altronate dehydratase large subunit